MVKKIHLLKVCFMFLVLNVILMPNTVFATTEEVAYINRTGFGVERTEIVEATSDRE